MRKKHKIKKLNLAIVILVFLAIVFLLIKAFSSLFNNSTSIADNNSIQQNNNSENLNNSDSNTSNNNSDNTNNNSDNTNKDNTNKDNTNKDNTNNDNTDNTSNNTSQNGTTSNESNEGEVKETFLTSDNIVTNTDSIQVVVNKQRNLSSTYVPQDLVKIADVPTVLANPEVNQLRKDAADALTELFKAADDEINIQLYARSGYRSYNTQVSLYNSYVENHGQEAADTFSAKPGQSEHQTGLSMDVTSQSVNLQLTEDFGDTEEGKWLNENAYKYGFIVRYPKGKEDVTGYMYEPWHIRYVGKELAKEVYESGKTLEQYLFGDN